MSRNAIHFSFQFTRGKITKIQKNSCLVCLQCFWKKKEALFKVVPPSFKIFSLSMLCCQRMKLRERSLFMTGVRAEEKMVR